MRPTVVVVVAGFGGWLTVHVVQLIGFPNKVFVLLNWAWDYFFYERASRLITEE